MKTDVSLERVEGALLGCALGDALGLPCEGLAPATQARRFSLERFELVGRTGFVSDDTEQSALVAEALAQASDPGDAIARFRWKLRWWFARLPFGIGFATLRACVKLWLGLRRSGVSSAGNGAAMRAGLVGVVVAERAQRHALVDALSLVTHAHPLGVEGARYVADVAALLARGAGAAAAVEEALAAVTQAPLREALEQACRLAPTLPRAFDASELAQVGRALGTTGFVVHSVGACTFCLLSARDAMEAIRCSIRLGGDTDTHAAIVGTWVGAAHGSSALDAGLLARLHDGPFGPTHLRGLARALTAGAPPPRWSALAALARNLALYPVVLAHGFRRLVPLG